ncbi:MAG: alpha/beta hydrolase [Pseudomonadota bacterium]
MAAPPALPVEEASVWHIGVRTLPPPAGASEVVRASIAGSQQPDVAARKLATPTSVTDWNALIKGREASSIELPELDRMFNVTTQVANIGGVKVYRVNPNEVAAVHKNHLFIYLHGGAYVFGGGTSGLTEAARIASTSGIAVVSVDYAMPPKDPFPAAVDEVITVYRELLKTVAPGAMAIGGTSAGGGLALASVHRMKQLRLPHVGAIYAGTPWADLTRTGDSLLINEGIDRVLVTYDAMLGAAARLYANGHDMHDPLLSPVYGDFSGFPPTYLVTGTRDMFLSDTARTHRQLRAAGVLADLNVYEGLSHAGYAFMPDSPESKQVYTELSAFLALHLQGDSD